MNKLLYISQYAMVQSVCAILQLENMFLIEEVQYWEKNYYMESYIEFILDTF